MNDNYDHMDDKIMYVVENMPGPLENSEEYREIINNFNFQISRHCTCNNICTNDCLCVQSSGGLNYFINKDENMSRLRLNEGKDFKIYPIQECNSLCKCESRCENRLVQHGPTEGLVIKPCPNNSKGYGLYTQNAILKGTFICEYAGEVISKTEALIRQRRNILEGKMNYIYCLKEHCNGTVTQTFIDPSKFGNIGRYMNHSCEPNCEIIPVRVDTLIPKLAIFSSVDIVPNTELTFDYGSHDVGNKLKPVSCEDGNKRKKCLCNSKKCKKWMPFDVY